MSRPSKNELTLLLNAWSEGDESALEKLMPVVYDELHRLAHRYMRNEKPGHTLQTTALVNEAYMRLVDMNTMHWQNRNHFFAISARLMRRILVDFARARKYLKRGGHAQQVSFDETLLAFPQKAADLVALDDALNAMAEIDPRKCSVVEMRFFAGMSVEETAEVLHVSADTVMRDWKMAKIWLLRELSKTART